MGEPNSDIDDLRACVGMISWRFRLALAVAGTAAAVLFTEIVITRLFSVLLFYHFSFLAVGLALFGLAGGGLIAATQPIGDSYQAFADRIRPRLLAACISLLLIAAFVSLVPPARNDLLVASYLAVASAMPFVLLGEVLTRALALGRGSIHRFYALDLIASSAAALSAIPLLSLIQGPFVLAVPALLALVLALVFAPPNGAKTLAGAGIVLGALLVIAGAQRGPLLYTADPWPSYPILERWNSHSRVRVAASSPTKFFLVIDRTASSLIPRVPRLDAQPPRIDSTWTSRFGDPSYAFRHPIGRVAIIGVGGGQDILPALAAGAGTIDGYEINGRILQLLKTTLLMINSAPLRPEVRLVHDEARHGLQHSSTQYDVIRANLIDTWAATAAGGFVLTESALYTVEGWRLFLRRLTSTGVLATTRWYLPASPAEAERLVALAAEALDEEKLTPAQDRVVALALPSQVVDPLLGGSVQTITTLVRRQSFSAEDVAALDRFAAERGGTLLLAPGRPPERRAAAWPGLLDRASRSERIRTSPWDIAPPTDDRPFFFLQARPRHIVPISSAQLGPVSEITVNGVRVLALAVVVALYFSALLVLWTRRLSRGATRGLGWDGRVYFSALGVGYICVQLALHQRLSIIIGHPTATLALVLATMLFGTGVGSWAAAQPWLFRRPRAATLVPLIAVVALVLGFSRLGLLSEATTPGLTASGSGTLTLVVGMGLGFALPTGMRAFAPTENTVAEAWALNGAFSVVGSTLAALCGLVFGGRAVATLAIPCYGLAWGLILLRTRKSEPLSIPPA